MPVTGGARICVEAIGDRDAPAILLIAGAGMSLDWWDDELCARLAQGGRLVVRYDHRDTGGSTSYPPGAPGYTGADLAGDAIAVLDALGIERAHVAGLSMGGALAQVLALGHRDRIATLTLMSTSPVDPSVEGLPGMTAELEATFSQEAPGVDWNDRNAVVAHLVEGTRPYAGPGTFDEPRTRALAGRIFDRSSDAEASLTNHYLLDGAGPEDLRLARLEGLPTLIVHGTADPMFPLPHGEALRDAIPGARLLELEGVGHEVPPPHTWDRLVPALLAHAAADPLRPA